MSYILDALKTADAKRGRDSLPGMHAPAARIVFAAARHETRPWLWVLAGAALVLLGWLTWWLVARPGAVPAPPVGQAGYAETALARGPSQAPAAGPAAAPAEAPAAVAPVTAPAALPAPGVQAPTAPIIRPVPQPLAQGAIEPVRPAPTQPVVAPTSNLAAPAARPTAPAAAGSLRADALPAVSAAPAPVQARSIPAAVAAAAPVRLASLEELPAELRREVPALAVSGSSYSENPAHRMLIINGQVLHEGESAGPDLVLEEIRLKLAVFRIKGTRFGLAY